jgi:hypothetical protein
MYEFLPNSSPENRRLNNILNARVLEVYHRKFQWRLYLVLYLVKAVVIFSTLAALLPLTGNAPQGVGWVLCIPCLCLIFDVNGRIYAEYQRHAQFSHVYEDFVGAFGEVTMDTVLVYERNYSQTRYLDGALDEQVFEVSKSKVLKQLDVYRGRLHTV